MKILNMEFLNMKFETKNLSASSIGPQRPRIRSFNKYLRLGVKFQKDYDNAIRS